MNKRMGLIAVVAAVVMFAVGCSADPPQRTTEPSSSTVTAAQTQSSSVEPTSPNPTSQAPDPIEPDPAPPVQLEEIPVAPPVAAPVIVDCQMGFGPITTYWSDGTVTGYSDYCQSVHDQVLQNEVDANTPICDGIVCTYPNGATIPDPNAVPDDRCTNQIDYANDPRSNAEINSIGASTGQCPAPIG